MAKTQDINTDITIIGGGLAGMSTAIGLAVHGFDVVVVDHASQADLTDAGYDGRSSALAFASCQLFEALGIWKHMEPYAQPMLEIRRFLHIEQRHAPACMLCAQAGEMKRLLHFSRIVNYDKKDARRVDTASGSALRHVLPS